MTSNERLQIKTNALRDQVWADADKMLDDVRRISAIGPDGSEHDAHVVRQAFRLLCGELCYRRADRLWLDEEIEPSANDTKGN